MEEDQFDWIFIKLEKKEDEDDWEYDVFNVFMDKVREKNEIEWNQKYNILEWDCFEKRLERRLK